MDIEPGVSSRGVVDVGVQQGYRYNYDSKRWERVAGRDRVHVASSMLYRPVVAGVLQPHGHSGGVPVAVGMGSGGGGFASPRRPSRRPTHGADIGAGTAAGEAGAGLGPWSPTQGGGGGGGGAGAGAGAGAGGGAGVGRDGGPARTVRRCHSNPGLGYAVVRSSSSTDLRFRQLYDELHLAYRQARHAARRRQLYGSTTTATSRPGAGLMGSFPMFNAGAGRPGVAAGAGALGLVPPSPLGQPAGVGGGGGDGAGGGGGGQPNGFGAAGVAGGRSGSPMEGEGAGGVPPGPGYVYPRTGEEEDATGSRHRGRQARLRSIGSLRSTSGGVFAPPTGFGGTSQGRLLRVDARSPEPWAGGEFQVEGGGGDELAGPGQGFWGPPRATSPGGTPHGGLRLVHYHGHGGDAMELGLVPALLEVNASGLGVGYGGGAAGGGAPSLGPALAVGMRGRPLRRGGRRVSEAGAGGGEGAGPGGRPAFGPDGGAGALLAGGRQGVGQGVGPLTTAPSLNVVSLSVVAGVPRSLSPVRAVSPPQYSPGVGEVRCARCVAWRCVVVSVVVVDQAGGGMQYG